MGAIKVAAATVAAAAIMATSPAMAEPVSAAIGLTALIDAVGLGGPISLAAGAGFGLSAAASAIGGALVSGVGLIALNAVTGALAAKRRGDLGLSTQAQNADLRITGRAGVVEYFTVVGQAFKSGYLFFEQAKGPFLYRGYILAPHEIDGVSQVRLGTTIIDLDASGFPVGAPFRTDTKTYFQVSIRNGTDDQEMDPILAADFSALDRSFRQRGIATAVIKMYRGADATEASNVWGQNDPTFLFLIRGKKFYDPRDGTQSAADPSTWRWTENSALITAGWRNDKNGANVPWSDIDTDALTVAANACDQIVYRADGTGERRYRSGGVIPSSTDPATTYKNLLAAMIGESTYIAGKSVIYAGVPREVERTLTQDDARSGIDATLARPWDDHVNSVRTTFVAAEREYTVNTGPVYSDDDLVAEDGTKKFSTIDLPFVANVGQVQRICRYIINQSMQGIILRRGIDISGMRHVAGDVVRVEMDGGLSLLSGSYKIIRHAESSERMDEYDLQLSQYDGPSLFAFDPLVDERDWSNALVMQNDN